MMNRRGFTLIELLAVIVIVGLLAVIIVPNFLLTSDKVGESSYNILIKSIKTGAESYYQECEYGNIPCQITNNQIKANIGTLAELGFLSGKQVSSGIKVVDPRDKENDLSSCQIIIDKKVSKVKDNNGIENTKVTYIISKNDDNKTCPSSDDYQNIK